jgi:integrase
MRGHIEKRFKSSYTIFLNLGYDPASGKRKQKIISVKGTKKDAEQRLAEEIRRIDTGTFINPEKTTLADYLNRWLNDYAWANLSPRTAEGYATVIKCHLIPKLGRLYLTQLTPTHIQNYYAEMLKSGRQDKTGGLNPRTVRSHHMILHRALKSAKKAGLIFRNPADADLVDLPRAPDYEMKPMDEDALNRFLETAKPTDYYTLFYLSLYTGMRRSEILALRWMDVDLIMCQVSVNRSLHVLRDRSVVFRQPKTSKSRRTIALTPSTAILLRKYYDDRTALFAGFGKKMEDSDLVFCHLDGSPLFPDTISNTWRKIAVKAGLKGVRLHDARHTHATLMLKQGVNIKVVQERLGHEKAQTTVDIYSHVLPGMQEKAACDFDNMVNTGKLTKV